MSKVKIITDSNSGILQEEGKELGVFVIPMPFTIDGEEYLEEISISQDKFYEFLAKDADVKTSQPSQFYLEDLWDTLLKENDELVYIPMMSGLSGTCENAKRYAVKYDGKVQVVDNARISVTQKASVLEAVELARMGKSAVEIKDYLEKTGPVASIYIMVSQLKYLKKGGRISPAVATVGSMLNVKPILYTRGKSFEKYGLAMSVGQARKKMIMKVKSELETEFKKEYDSGKIVISVAHTQNQQEAEKFKQEIIETFPNAKFKFVDPLSLSVSCHIGAGSLAIAICVANYLK